MPSKLRIQAVQQQVANGEITQVISDPDVRQAMKENIHRTVAAAAIRVKRTPPTGDDAATRLDLAAYAVRGFLQTNPTVPGLPKVDARLQRHLNGRGSIRKELAANPKLAVAIDALECKMLGEMRLSLPPESRTELDIHLMYPVSVGTALSDVYGDTPQSWTLANLLADHPELGGAATEATRLMLEQREQSRPHRRRDGIQRPTVEQRQTHHKALHAAVEKLLTHPDVDASCCNFIESHSPMESAATDACSGLDTIFDRQGLSPADQIRALGAVGVANRETLASGRGAGAAPSWQTFPMPRALLARAEALSARLAAAGEPAEGVKDPHADVAALLKKIEDFHQESRMDDLLWPQVEFIAQGRNTLHGFEQRLAQLDKQVDGWLNGGKKRAIAKAARRPEAKEKADAKLATAQDKMRPSKGRRKQAPALVTRPPPALEVPTAAKPSAESPSPRTPPPASTGSRSYAAVASPGEGTPPPLASPTLPVRRPLHPQEPYNLRIGGEETHIRSKKPRAELLAYVDTAFDAGTFPTPLDSADKHVWKHQARHDPQELFEHYVDRARAAIREARAMMRSRAGGKPAPGLTSRPRLSDPRERVFVYDTPTTYLVFSPDDKIISFRDRARFGRA
jgi:hypothetical protein